MQRVFWNDVISANPFIKILILVNFIRAQKFRIWYTKIIQKMLNYVCDTLVSGQLNFRIKTIYMDITGFKS